MLSRHHRKPTVQQTQQDRNTRNRATLESNHENRSQICQSGNKGAKLTKRTWPMVKGQSTDICVPSVTASSDSSESTHERPPTASYQPLVRRKYKLSRKNTETNVNQKQGDLAIGSNPLTKLKTSKSGRRRSRKWMYPFTRMHVPPDAFDVLTSPPVLTSVQTNNAQPTLCPCSGCS